MTLPLPKPDQSLDSLQRCYTYSGPPDSVEPDRFEGKDLNWKLVHFGLQARSRRFCDGIFQELRSLNAKDAVNDITDDTALVEYIWFLFGQKDWISLLDVFGALDVVRLAALPVEIADLYMLACLRLYRKDFALPERKAQVLLRLDNARRLIETAWPDATVRAEYFAAISQHVGGDIAKARQVFAHVPRSTRLAGPLRAVSSVLSPGDYTATEMPRLDIARVSGPKNVVVISLDQGYYRKFFPQFLRSHQAQAHESHEKWGLHLHCIGFDPGDEEFKASPDIGVTIDCRFSGEEYRLWKAAYSACARFVFSELYLNIYEQIFICDVDGVVAQSLDALHHTAPEADVLLYSPNFLERGCANPLPWNSIHASNILLRRTTGGLLFARHAGKYLSKVFSGKPDALSPWFADQNALFYSYVDSKTQVRFGKLSQRPFNQAANWRQFSGDLAKRDFIRQKLTSPETDGQ